MTSVFVDKRADERERANAAEARRKGDVARYHAGRREQNRWASIRFFDRMAANHAALAEGFRSRAEALISDEADRGQAGARMKVNEGNPIPPAAEETL